MPTPATRQPAALITGVSLAGGQGTRMGAVEVDFSDQGDAFGDFNTLDDLARS